MSIGHGLFVHYSLRVIFFRLLPLLFSPFICIYRFIHLVYLSDSCTPTPLFSVVGEKEKTSLLINIGDSWAKVNQGLSGEYGMIFQLIE